MTTDELELERVTQEVMEYVSRYLSWSVDYDTWLKDVNHYEVKSFIREVIKNGITIFGNNDSLIVPMYKSFVLGLRVARGKL